MNIKLDILADIIEKGLMKLRISSIRDIGVISKQNRASAKSDLDYMQSWAFLNGALADLCLEADAIKGVVKVARPITKGFEYKDLFGDVSILRLDILEEK
jgi:hypothetical protein